MEDKDLYVMAVMKYKKENPLLNPNNMFSIEWNLSSDYHLKTLILTYAIKNHTLVEQTPFYQEYFVEKIKDTKSIFYN